MLLKYLAISSLLSCSLKAFSAQPDAASPHPDAVSTLPEIGKPDDAMYSGYVPIDGTSKKIHYLFVESKKDAKKDPLILWFNGGPGCSSLYGFF